MKFWSDPEFSLPHQGIKNSTKHPGQSVKSTSLNPIWGIEKSSGLKDMEVTKVKTKIGGFKTKEVRVTVMCYDIEATKANWMSALMV